MYQQYGQHPNMNVGGRDVGGIASHQQVGYGQPQPGQYIPPYDPRMQYPNVGYQQTYPDPRMQHQQQYVMQQQGYGAPVINNPVINNPGMMGNHMNPRHNVSYGNPAPNYLSGHGLGITAPESSGVANRYDASKGGSDYIKLNKTTPQAHQQSPQGVPPVFGTVQDSNSYASAPMTKQNTNLQLALDYKELKMSESKAMSDLKIEMYHEDYTHFNSTLGWWLVDGSPHMDKLHYLRLKSMNDDLDAVVFNSVYELSSIVEVDRDVSLGFLSKEASIDSLIKSLGRRREESTGALELKYFDTIVGALTHKLNAKMKLINIPVAIDDIVADYRDLVGAIKSMGLSEDMDDAFNTALNDIHAFAIKLADADAMKVSGRAPITGKKYKEVITPIECSMMYIANVDAAAALRAVYDREHVDNSVLLITESSAPQLYAYINEIEWQKDVDMYIVTDDNIYIVERIDHPATSYAIVKLY